LSVKGFGRMLLAMVLGTKPMQTAKVMKRPRPTAQAMRDLRRDWDGWSPWERRAVTTLAAASFAASLFWLGMSVNLLF